MGNLRQQGYRLMVNKQTLDAEWIHPAEVEKFHDYTDCTDMTDEEFDLFMGVTAQ